MGPGSDADDPEAWRRLNRGPTTVPGVMGGDISAWLGTLDEAAVAQVLEVYLPTETKTSSLHDVTASTGIATSQLRLFWRALGFAQLEDGEPQLTAHDVELLTTFASFFGDGTREQGVGLQMARVIGSNLDRIASAQVDMLVARVLLNGPDVDVAAERSRQFGDLLPRLLELIWRHHLGDAARRRLLRPTVGDTASVCVGFADMVGFTATAQQLNQLELARIVGWFEAKAYEIVTAGGGRVVKTIGDEVMFVSEDARSGAAIALDLAQQFSDDPAFPNVHVGIATGPVIQRRGDIYGPTVNLAARIVAVALPGTVLVSDTVHDQLADDTTFDFRTSFEYDLDAIGTVTLWRIRRPGTPGVASRALLMADDAWQQRFAGDRRVAEADDAAVERLRQIENETIRRITGAETAARAQVADALRWAREQTDDVDAEARARVQQLIDRARQQDRVGRPDAGARATRDDESHDDGPGDGHDDGPGDGDGDADPDA